MMNETRLNELVCRIQKLERSNRFHRFGWMAAVAFAFVAFLSGAVEQRPHGEIVCKDGAGTIRTQMGVWGGNATMTSVNVHDTAGRARISNTVHDQGRAEITVLDANGNDRIRMGVNERGQTYLLVDNGRGGQRNLADF